MGSSDHAEAVRAEVRCAPRPSLSRQRVLEAGLRYADEHGLASLSMRRLGNELGVAAMSLYKYIADKDDLLDGIVELLWAELSSTVDVSQGWRESLRVFAHALRDPAHRHPDTSHLLMSRGVLPPSLLRLSASYLCDLQAAGFTRQRSVEILRTVIAYAYGYALTEISGLRSIGTGGTTEAPEFQVLRKVIQALPTDLPDELAQVAVALASCDSAAQFASGLDFLLRGISPSDPTP